MSKALEQLKLQKAEFDAADRFAKKLKAHSQVAVVDDDYPMVRHEYESALLGLITAMRQNSRFDKGNRYGLTIV